jgi:predicted transcriptional regulator
MLKLVAHLTGAYLSRHPMPVSDVPALVNSVSLALRTCITPSVQVEPQQPAVPIKRSVTPEYIICLEDGKKLKMLRRHLRTAFNMTPEEYRTKWGLAADYPMVAPNYSSHRSSLAQKSQLGHRPRAATPAVKPTGAAPGTKPRKTLKLRFQTS